MNLTQIVYSNDLAPTGELYGIFISRTCAFDENTVLNSSEANTHIKKNHKHKLRYERKSRMKPGKEPHAAREPRVGQAWYRAYHVIPPNVICNSIVYFHKGSRSNCSVAERTFLFFLFSVSRISCVGVVMNRSAKQRSVDPRLSALGGLRFYACWSDWDCSYTK